MTLLNCVGGSGGGGGGGGGTTPWKEISADYTVTVEDISSGKIVLEVDASAANVQIIVPPGLGTASVTPEIGVLKVDTSAHAVNISDGTNLVDAIVTPASAYGQCDGRTVRANGTNLRVSVG